MNSRDHSAILEMIRLCIIGEQLVERGYDWYSNDPQNVPGMAAESLIIKLGENVARLSRETLDTYPSIPWSHIKRMRDLLAHHYEGTDYGAVWDTLVNDLPTVRRLLESISFTD
ncbi:MAG: DUF86 domain-containing protein [Ancrocorticia sp.]